MYRLDEPLWVELTYIGGTDGKPAMLDCVYMLDRRPGKKGIASSFWRQSDVARFGYESLSTELLESIREDLRSFRARLPDLDIEAVWDTSLGWSQLTFRVIDDTDTWTYSLPLRLSGFCGKDASMLDSLLRKMLSCVIPDNCLVFARLTAAN